MQGDVLRVLGTYIPQVLGFEARYTQPERRNDKI